MFLLQAQRAKSQAGRNKEPQRQVHVPTSWRRYWKEIRPFQHWLPWQQNRLQGPWPWGSHVMNHPSWRWDNNATHVCTFKRWHGGSWHRDTWPCSSQMPDWFSGNACLPLTKGEPEEEERETERERKTTLVYIEKIDFQPQLVEPWLNLQLRVLGPHLHSVRLCTSLMRKAVFFFFCSARWHACEINVWEHLRACPEEDCEELWQVSEEEVAWHVLVKLIKHGVAWSSVHASEILNYSNGCAILFSVVLAVLGFSKK